MSDDEGNRNDEAQKEVNAAITFFVIRGSSLIRHSDFGMNNRSW